MAKGFDLFFAAYMECALFSSTDNSREDGGDPLDDNYDETDIAPECRAEMAKDCASFLESNKTDIGTNYTQAGHDFWLTRNCHGAGFWDGDWPADAGERLTDAAHAYGSCDLFVNDDGMIYSM